MFLHVVLVDMKCRSRSDSSRQCIFNVKYSERNNSTTSLSHAITESRSSRMSNNRLKSGEAIDLINY